MKKTRKRKGLFSKYKVQFRYNPELDKYEDKVLAPEKLAKANEMLEKVKNFPPQEH
jgi:hypothetical protein